MSCSGHDIAWRGGQVRTLCGCGWMSSGRTSIDEAVADHRRHAGNVIVMPTEGTVSISLLQASNDLRSPRRHWHVIESSRHARSFRRARVVGRTGVSTARDAYRTLTERTSELLLEDWHLDLDESSDRLVVLTKTHLSVTINVDECWEVACIGALRASSLGATVAF